MKRLSILFFLPIFGILTAQPTEIPQNLAQLLDVPFFNHPSSPTDMVYQFDKKIKVEATGADGQKSDLFIYINTSTGVVGSFSGKPGSFGSGNIDRESEKFRLTLQHPNGTIINYFNTKKKNEILHRYSSLQTEVFPMELGQLNSTIHKTGTTKNVLSQGFTAAEYTGSGGSGSTFLCGAINQNQVKFSKFLGYASIGYVKTNHGIMMIVENSSAAGSFKAVNWQNGNYTFDSEGFNGIEDEMFTKANESIDTKIEKLNNAESSSGNCGELEDELKRVKLENLNKQKEALAQSRTGNLYDNANAQKGITDMYDLKGAVVEGLISNAIRVCTIESKEERDEEDQLKLECLSRQRMEMNRFSLELDALEAEFADDFLKLHTEKMKLLQGFSQLESCR